jgi:hypothetical protein
MCAWAAARAPSSFTDTHIFFRSSIVDRIKVAGGANMDFRAQLVRAVASKDDVGLGRLYVGVAGFQREHPDEYAGLPVPLREAAAAQTSALAIHRDWDVRVKKGETGPHLWPWWSGTRPAPSELATVTAKYRQCRRKVVRFEKWYAEFEALNGRIMVQLGEAYRLLTGVAAPAELDEIAASLLAHAQSVGSDRTSTATDA